MEEILDFHKAVYLNFFNNTKDAAQALKSFEQEIFSKEGIDN